MNGQAIVQLEKYKLLILHMRTEHLLAYFSRWLHLDRNTLQDSYFERGIVYTMMSCRYSPLSIALAFFLLFSLNTWIFLQHSMDPLYDSHGIINNLELINAKKDQHIREKPNSDMDKTVISKRERLSILTHLTKHKDEKFVVSLDDTRQLPETIIKRSINECKTLLTRRGYNVKQGEQDQVNAEQDSRQLSYERDNKNLMDVRKVMEMRHRNIRIRELDSAENPIATSGLEYPLLLRTDDARTTQTMPWGPIPEGCSTKDYGNMKNLGKISVIICFHENEHLADVLHTVHSIVQRTPPELLKEVLLVDDYSKKEDFRQILDQYVSAIFTNHNVKVIRSKETLGLIQCRLHGAHLAQGDIIYFMDSHMEVQPKWVEPLLWEIKLNPQTLATSYLDWMERDVNGSWSYRHGASSWKTYFDWKFVFGFQTTSAISKSPDMTEPVRCPVSVGGVFAINRQFFLDIGGFDEGMWGWGGENLDLPIRVWLFGGRVVNVPCSHVGHLENPGSRNYRLSWQLRINQNYKRVAEVWLGEYKKYFYYYNPSFKSINPGNLTSRLELAKRAPHTFSWILKNVFPELGMYDKDTFAWEGLRNLRFNTCLWAVASQTHPMLRSCNINDTTRQGFFLNGRGELRFPVHIFNAYGDQLRSNEYIGQYNTDAPTRWIHWPGGPMRQYSSNQCLEAVDMHSVIINPCDGQSISQQWMFNTYSDKLSTLLQSRPRARNNNYMYTLYNQYFEAHINVTLDASA